MPLFDSKYVEIVPDEIVLGGRIIVIPEGMTEKTNFGPVARPGRHRMEGLGDKDSHNCDYKYQQQPVNYSLFHVFDLL
jgi:hypothetical protein